jgi:MoaA/NifB/PqqE/SkfB family radical SAM enzyme
MRLAPAYFFLQYTSLCNSRCTTCHLWQRPPETIPVQVLERLGLFVDPINVRSIFFTGGEPLLPPECVAIAEAVNRWKPGVALIGSTNGICPDLYLARAKAMLAVGVRIRLAVSLNGMPETHDRSRGVPGNYGTALEMARGLHGLGILASLNVLFIPGETTPADVRHVQDLAAGFGVPCWSSPILRHNPWFGEEDDGATVPQIDNCLGGTDVLTIRPNGDITACQEPRPALVFGNLRDDGLDPDRVARIQAAVKARACQPCGCCTNSFSHGIFVS